MGVLKFLSHRVFWLCFWWWIQFYFIAINQYGLYDFCFMGVDKIFRHDLICDQFSFVSIPDWEEWSLLCSMFYFISLRSNLLISLFKYFILLFVHLFNLLIPKGCVIRYTQKFMSYISLANTPFCPFHAFA